MLLQGGVCVGLVVRDHLLKLLVEAVKRGTCQHLEVPFTGLNRQYVEASALESEAAQQMAVLEVRLVWCGVVRCGVVWCGVVWCGVVWCGVVQGWAGQGAQSG